MLSHVLSHLKTVPSIRAGVGSERLRVVSLKGRYINVRYEWMNAVNVPLCTLRVREECRRWALAKVARNRVSQTALEVSEWLQSVKEMRGNDWWDGRRLDFIQTTVETKSGTTEIEDSEGTYQRISTIILTYAFNRSLRRHIYNYITLWGDRAPIGLYLLSRI